MDREGGRRDLRARAADAQGDGMISLAARSRGIDIFTPKTSAWRGRNPFVAFALGPNLIFPLMEGMEPARAPAAAGRGC